MQLGSLRLTENTKHAVGHKPAFQLAGGRASRSALGRCYAEKPRGLATPTATAVKTKEEPRPPPTTADRLPVLDDLTKVRPLSGGPCVVQSTAVQQRLRPAALFAYAVWLTARLPASRCSKHAVKHSSSLSAATCLTFGVAQLQHAWGMTRVVTRLHVDPLALLRIYSVTTTHAARTHMQHLLIRHCSAPLRTLCRYPVRGCICFPIVVLTTYQQPSNLHAARYTARLHFALLSVTWLISHAAPSQKTELHFIHPKHVNVAKESPDWGGKPGSL